MVKTIFCIFFWFVNFDSFFIENFKSQKFPITTTTTIIIKGGKVITLYIKIVKSERGITSSSQIKNCH